MKRNLELHAAIQRHASGRHDAKASVKSRYTTEAHPFRRYFARIGDILVLGLPATILFSAAAYAINPDWMAVSSTGGKAILNWLNFLICLVMTGVLCAALLATWGSTPGKKLFGIELSSGGEKLELTTAIRRETRVLTQGMCVGIPLLLAAFNYASSLELRTRGATDWDITGNVDVMHRRWGFFRLAGVVLFSCAAPVAAWLLCSAVER